MPFRLKATGIKSPRYSVILLANTPKSSARPVTRITG